MIAPPFDALLQGVHFGADALIAGKLYGLHPTGALAFGRCGQSLAQAAIENYKTLLFSIGRM